MEEPEDSEFDRHARSPAIEAACGDDVAGTAVRMVRRSNANQYTRDQKLKSVTLFMFLTGLQRVSDYIGARVLPSGLPNVKWLLGDRGDDADWLKEALQDKGIRACIPGRRKRKMPVKYDKRRYKRRNRIEVMFGRLKDWRRVATRYDRCPSATVSEKQPKAGITFCGLSEQF